MDTNTSCVFDPIEFGGDEYMFLGFIGEDMLLVLMSECIISMNWALGCEYCWHWDMPDRWKELCGFTKWGER